MAFFGGRGGNNPAHGRDLGPPPPMTRQPNFNFYQAYGGYPPQPSFFPGGAFPQPSPYTTPWGSTPSPAVLAGTGIFHPGLPRGTYGPAGQPVINAALPAANMTNSTGGVGCEPGYNYFFPAEHTKILMFRTGATPPWQLPPNFSAPFHAVHVPVHTTVGDLLKGFGATNPNPQKNKVVELHQGGNGRWYKGMSFRGDKDKDMDKTLKSVGWDASRTGLPGQKPVVYLYITKG